MTAKELDRLHRYILGLVYIFWWTWRAKIRYFLTRWAVALLFLFIIFALAEVTLEFLGRSMGVSSSLVLKVAFFALILVTFYGKIREWKENRQEFYFVQAAKQVTEILSAETGSADEEAVLRRLLAIFVENFRNKRRGTPSSAVFTRNGDVVRLSYAFPNSNYYPQGFALPEGKGCAGYCCKNRCVVYIPRKDLRHGIIQTIEDDQPYRMEQDLFEPLVAIEQTFQSILGVPMVAYGTNFGALCFESERPNAFHRLDFEQAWFFGLVVAQFLHSRARARVPGAQAQGLGT